MELNLTCILTSSLPVEICVGELQQVTSLLFSLFSFFFFPRRKFFAPSDSFANRISKFFSFILSLSLSPPSSFLNSVPPIHRIEENLSNSRFGRASGFFLLFAPFSWSETWFLFFLSLVERAYSRNFTV